MTVVIRCPSNRYRWVAALRPGTGATSRRARQPKRASIALRLNDRTAKRWSAARFVRDAAIVAATVVATLAASLFVTIHAFTATSDDWTIPVRFGLLGCRSSIDAEIGPAILNGGTRFA